MDDPSHPLRLDDSPFLYGVAQWGGKNISIFLELKNPLHFSSFKET
jgi:hypothetical protein